MSLSDDARDVYEHGLPPGDSTGWASVDRLFRVGLNQWTGITGIPGSGKSEWVDALAINLLMASEDWGFVFYSPENFPTHTHLIKLAEKVVGKPFNPGPTPRMTLQEFDGAADRLRGRVRWINPDYKDLRSLLDAAFARAHLHRKLGVVIDPWNYVDVMRLRDENEADYLSRSLGLVATTARAHDAHIFIVAHPKVMDRGKDGTRPVPTPYDISGGAHWFNKSDNMIAIHREQTDPPTRDVDVYVQKVKRKWQGHIGVATLQYNKVIGTYEDF